MLNFASKLDSDDTSKFKRSRPAIGNSQDDAVYSRFTQRFSLGDSISGPFLCEKALYFNNKLGCPAYFKDNIGSLKNEKSH